MTFSPRAIEAAKAIDFAKEARDLKQALADNAYPAADGSADIDNHAIPIIEATLRNVAERFLTAALAVDGVALQGWRPIDSAPVGDDDFFLVCGVGDDRSAFVVRGSILKNTRMANTPSHLSMHWLTHWMPLPPPPAASDREEWR